MFESLSTPSDHFPIDLTPPDQTNQAQPFVTHDSQAIPVPLQELPLAEWMMDTDAFLDEIVSAPTDCAEDFAAQAIYDFEPVHNALTQEMQSAIHSVNTLPRFQPLPTYLLDPLPLATGQAILQQTKPFLDIAPFHTALNELQTSSIVAASRIVSEVAAVQRSTTTLAMSHLTTAWTEPLQSASILFASNTGSVFKELLGERITSLTAYLAQDLLHTNAQWNALVPSFSALALPTWNTANLLSLSSFLPDMRWLDSLTNSLNTLLHNDPIWEVLKNVEKRVKHSLFAAFKDVGLCFAPSMSEDLMHRIAEVFASSGKRGVILLVWNYYARNNHKKLREMVEQWQENSVYARLWRVYLEPALRAHMNKDYGLSISTLTPRVEGISSYVVQRNDLRPHVVKNPRRGHLDLGDTKSVILRALNAIGDTRNLDQSHVSMSDWVRIKSAIGYIEDVFCKHLAFEQDYEHISDHERLMNRHGVSHGIQINVITPFNSLRMFLLLDTMYGLLQNYIAKGATI